jgi:hypothetical protein
VVSVREQPAFRIECASRPDRSTPSSRRSVGINISKFDYCSRGAGFCAGDGDRGSRRRGSKTVVPENIEVGEIAGEGVLPPNGLPDMSELASRAVDRAVHHILHPLPLAR